MTVLRFTDNGNEKCGYYFPGSAYIKWLMYNYYALTGSDIIILKRYKRILSENEWKTTKQNVCGQVNDHTILLFHVYFR